MLTHCNPQEMERQLRSYSKMFETQIVDVTNKKMVFCCLVKEEALNLATNLKQQGFHVEVKRGLKTPRYYVAAFFH